MIIRSYYFFLFLETRLCIAAVTEDPLTRNEATVREELQANGSIRRNERRKQRNKKKTKSKTIQYTACVHVKAKVHTIKDVMVQL